VPDLDVLPENMTKRFAAHVVLILAVCATSCSVSDNPQRSLSKARKYEEQGKYKEAAVWAKKAMPSNNHRKEAQAILSRSEEGRLKELVDEIWDMSDDELDELEREEGVYVTRDRF
jgi:hypothetical protein